MEAFPAWEPTGMPNLGRNKQAVMAFYDLMFNQGRPREAIERYAGAEYIQHNPGVKTARKGSSNISRTRRAAIRGSGSTSNV